ncbi:MAG: VOC family protein [Pseudooceanicola sp.]
MPVSVTPFLMYQGSGVEAAETYAALFPEGAFRVEQRDDSGAPMLMRLTIGGQDVMMLNSDIAHEFDFTPTFSFFVSCPEEAEVDRLYAALSEGGTELMPLGEYPFSPRYGWVTDRFGVSWQIGVET